jgi:iron complex outermembrane receptor protein
VKLSRLSFDADVFHVHFDNAYSSYKVTDPSNPNFGDSYYYATPPSNATGFEAEGNLYAGHGLSFNFTGTAARAKYEASAGQTLANGSVLAPTVAQWVAAIPDYTVSAGVTYTDKHWAAGFFNKDVGPRYVDNGSVHQATQLNSFWMNNLYFNYKLPTNSFFNGSKIKLSFTNLFNFHDVVNLAPGVGATAAVPYVQSGSDALQLLPGRSIMVTFELAMAPRRR